MRGVAQKTLNLAELRAVFIPVPDLAEQERIAEILDKADALRAKRRATLAQLDKLTQSTFIETFGEPPIRSKRWKHSPLGEIVENQDYLRVPIESSERDLREGEYPYYGASGIIDSYDDFIFEGDRLLVGEDGANLVARATPIAFMARGKYWVNNHAHVLASNGRANLRFLEFFINSVDLTPYLSGTAQPKLNRGNLDRIPVPVPPIELQQEFASHLSSLEKMNSAYLASQLLLNQLFASLQHRAFVGEL